MMLEAPHCVRWRGWLVCASPDVPASQRDAHLLQLAISNGHTVLQAHSIQCTYTSQQVPRTLHNATELSHGRKHAALLT
jgi:hypothetical protein